MAIRTDALCLVLMTFLTAVPYVGKLGFYSDDWYVLYSFHAQALQHSFGIRSALHYDPARPVQGLYLALLYALFGFRPLGYHLVNTGVIAAAVALFYWLLMRLKIDRPTALAATIVLTVLPQLSTVRVWYLTFQIPLSMLLMLVSLHCQLSLVRTGKIGWAVAAAIAAVTSIAAYEIFAPLIGGFAAVLLFLQWREHGRGRGLRPLAAVVVMVAASALAKFLLSDRPQPPDWARYVKGLIQLVRPDYDWRTDYSLNIFAAADVHFWWPLLGWVRGAEALVRGEIGSLGMAAALAAAVLAFWRVHAAGRPGEGPWSNRRLLLLGLATFVLGHAVFVIVPSIFFSPTGIANRALVAGALGVALILVAAIRFAAGRLPARHRSLSFASAIAAIAFFGTLRILQIAHYWSEAPAIEQKVLTAARSDLRELPANAVVMLDNVCPYHGPAVVFEAPWDVSGAMSLALARPVAGDTVSPRMSVQAGGLATSIYGEPAFYPYGPSLYVYDPARHRVAQLSDFVAARRYFDEARTTRAPCPRGYAGHGVPI